MSGPLLPRVLIVGDLNPDIVVRSPSAPHFDQVEQLVDGIDITLGGSAGIVACGTARLGLDTTLVAAVGDDEWGRWCTGLLTGRGVRTSALRTVPAPTGATVLLLRDAGTDRAILTTPGAIGELRGTDVPDSLLAEHAHLHICSMFLVSALRPGLLDLCWRARQLGLRISLDPNYDPSQRWDAGDDLLAAVDVLLVNAAEAAALAASGSDLTGSDPAGTDKAARLLAERCATVVVKDGSRGALLAQGAEVTRISAPAVRAVDATGAGDSLAAGLIFGLVAGWPAAEAVAFGVACGSASTQAVGGIAAQPARDEAQALAATIAAGQP
ncbi:MAG: sugar kinase [Actinomycetota bacterium]|nr:sugar kinase [Actinomycetota bacterium]